jgi:hypothetical protein
MQNLKPMDAVSALYAPDNPALSTAIMDSLSRSIFEGNSIKPAGTLKRALARVSLRVMQLTTRTGKVTDHAGTETTTFSNRILEGSGHPYARLLLTSSSDENATLVEGGDPMNGPYMMISPEIRKNCGLWDKLFFDSVQSRDVQSRIIWETQATYEAAKGLLEHGEPVRLKAVAAGTGLSMMLVYDRLLRDGFNPELISAKITDRDAANTVKSNRLLDTLAETRNKTLEYDWRRGITAVTEDIFAEKSALSEGSHDRYDIVTAIGILEYFKGSAYASTEERLRLEQQSEAATAHDLVSRLTDMTTDRARLIVNTYRDHISTRILELFGKRFFYRNIQNVQDLLESARFQQSLVVGSGNIYDVKVYEKKSLLVQ